MGIIPINFCGVGIPDLVWSDGFRPQIERNGRGEAISMPYRNGRVCQTTPDLVKGLRG